MKNEEALLTETKIEMQPQAVAEVWNRLSGGSPVELDEVWHDKDEVMERLWESFREGINKYIFEFDVPISMLDNETVPEFAVRILEHMKELNKGSSDFRSWCENPVVSMNQGNGAYNCVFGAQVVAVACERAGIEAGIALPYGHAATVISDEDGGYLYLDVSNTQIAVLEPYAGNADFGDANMASITEVLYGREVIPYTYVPVASKAQSVAVTLGNLGYLRDIASKDNKFAQSVSTHILRLDPPTDYSSSKEFFLPSIAKLRELNAWKDERDKVIRTIDEMSKVYIKHIDKISTH